MAQINYYGNKTVLTVTANVNLSLANLAANSSETVTGATIAKIFFSTSNTTTGIKINRGSNTYLILSGTGQWELDSAGVSLSYDPAANVQVVIPDGNSSAHIVIKKVSTLA